jgi:hypothetical protein
VIGLATFFNPAMNAATHGAIETVGFVHRLVGAPSQGWVRGALAQYRCGDLPCVDLGGCAACAAPGRDVTRVGGIPARADTAVVLCQYVLEYTHDPKAGYAEMVRVAGAERNVFVNRVPEWVTGTRVMTGQNFLITEPPRLSDDRWFHPVRRTFVAVQKKRRIG